MKRFLCIFAGLLTAVLSAQGPCKVREKVCTGGVREYTLTNEQIAVTVLPAASAMISGMEIVPEKRQLISPVKLIVREDDLLPMRLAVRPNGVRDLVWELDQHTQVRFQLIRRESGSQAQLELLARGYRNVDATARKTVTINANEAKVLCRFSLTWHDRKAQKLTFWLNAIAQMGTPRDTVLLPVKGNTPRRGKIGVQLFAADGIYADSVLNPQQLYAAPNDSFFARVSPEKPGVLVIRTGKKFAEAGCFLAWKSPTLPLHTMEMIFPGTQLKYGETVTWEYELLYFAGLRSLRGTAGHYAVDREGDALVLASAVPVPSGGALKWTCRTAENKQPEEKTIPFEGLVPGKTLRIPLDGKSGAMTLQTPDGTTLEIQPLTAFATEKP